MVDVVAITKDGKLLAAASVPAVKFWDVAEGKAREGVAHLFLGAISLAFSDDGTLLAVGTSTQDGIMGQIRLWDVAAAKFREPFIETGKKGSVQSMAFTPDGKLLAASGKEGVRFWDLAENKWTTELPADGYTTSSVAFSADGSLLATGSYSGDARVWDVKTQKEKVVCAGTPGQMNIKSPIRGVALTKDGKYLATARADQKIDFWDVGTGKQVATLQGHTAEVNSVAFSPDGKTLASGSSDKTVKLWDVSALVK
jgi:WD40 repeat protein